MSNPKKDRWVASGPRRMTELGKKASQLWYTPEQFDLVKKAAMIDRRPMTQFAILATLAAADQVVKQHNGHFKLKGPKGVSRG